MFARNFWELPRSPADSQCPYSPVRIGNNASNRVLSVTGFLWFSISHKINLKEKKKPYQNKAYGNHESLAQKNY